MFERRQKSASALHFSQSKRRLKADEQVPVRLSLLDQLMACQAQPESSRLGTSSHQQSAREDID